MSKTLSLSKGHLPFAIQAKLPHDHPVFRGSYPLLLISLISIVTCATAFAGDPGKKELPIGVFPRVSRELFTDKLARRIPSPDPPAESTLQYDVREYLANNGVELLPGEEAIFDAYADTLIVRARNEVIDLVQSFNLTTPVLGTPNLQVEAALVELTAGNPHDLTGPTSYPEFRKAAGDSWRVLDRAVGLTKPNLDTTVLIRNSEAHPVAQAPEEGKAPASTSSLLSSDGEGGPSRGLLAGENGTVFECKLLLGPDYRTVELTFIYHHRSSGLDAMDWVTKMVATVMDGEAKVVQIQSAPPGADGTPKIRALILRADVVGEKPWTPRREEPNAGKK